MARKYKNIIGASPAPKRTALTEPAVTDTDDVDLDKLTKDQLIELADERGVDSSGTKADIIGRLTEES